MDDFRRGYEIGKAEAAQGMTIKPARSSMIKYYMAGFGRTVVATLTTPIIGTGALTRPFRGERLGITNDVAGSFQIVSAVAGPENLMVNALGVPARLFAENGADICLDFPTIDPALGINLGVNNFTGVGATFEGAVLGFALVKTGAGQPCATG